MKKKDSNYEGRENVFLDVDRMTNEGLAGGTVTGKYDHPQIEEAQDFKEEEEEPKEV
ncbi:hypothetical protein [Anaerobacillus alkalidiazotrophicus]|uniref:hypothetical protein n=1 Tax=Anaerobacillus alkalidiazotrophicus TaxID=472963 RepID=UPI001471193A|nr:hypothetical protein [Anaerobacillus alkalidiazotrophicus]